MANIIHPVKKMTVFHYKCEVLEHLGHQENNILQVMMVNIYVST